MKTYTISVFAMVVAMTAAVFAEAPLRVGIYGDRGSDSTGLLALWQWIEHSPDMDTVVLSGSDIGGTGLDDLDLVVFASGGAGANALAYDALGETGRAKLENYIRGGGKCLATGMGATLLSQPTNANDKCLGLIPYESRGSLPSRIQLGLLIANAGADPLGIPGGTHGGTNTYYTLRYSHGPYLRYKSGSVDDSSFNTWATYRSSINLNGRVDAQMFGSAAIIGGRVGSGKIVAFAHEPQYEYYKNEYIVAAVRWLTGRTVDIPLRPRARGAISVGVAMDGIRLCEVIQLLGALDHDQRFDLTGFDTMDVPLNTLEGLDSIVFPNGSDAAAFAVGGESRTLVAETATSGVKVFAWGSGVNLLPLDNATTCADSADAFSKLKTAFGLP